MNKSYHSIALDRGIALHKMIRLITFSTSGGGYLNFMGMNLVIPNGLIFHGKETTGALSMLVVNGNLQKTKILNITFCLNSTGKC